MSPLLQSRRVAFPIAGIVLVLSAALWLWVPLLPAAGTPGAADAAAIRRVVERQLAAIRRDDGAEAFSYAAPAIQQQFRTPEAFMHMVRTGYRPVYRPRQVIFQDVLRHDGQWVQPLLVTAEDGRIVVALYEMERQPDATWRVSGVLLLAANAQGA